MKNILYCTLVKDLKQEKINIILDCHTLLLLLIEKKKNIDCL